jgi:cbb3-type cytochrome oxidase subunit 1
VYRVLPSLKIYFIVRGISGVLMLAGGCLFVWNVLFTLLGRGEAALAHEEAPAGSARDKEVAA